MHLTMKLVPVMVAVALALAGCGGGSDDEPQGEGPGICEVLEQDPETCAETRQEARDRYAEYTRCRVEDEVPDDECPTPSEQADDEP